MAKKRKKTTIHPAVIAVVALVALAGGGYAVVKIGPKLVGKGKKTARGPHKTDAGQHLLSEFIKPENAQHAKDVVATAKAIGELFA